MRSEDYSDSRESPSALAELSAEGLKLQGRAVLFRHLGLSFSLYDSVMAVVVFLGLHPHWPSGCPESSLESALFYVAASPSLCTVTGLLTNSEAG